MGLVLGLDGKKRALEISLNFNVPQIITVYVGLLQSAPGSMDGMDLASLISNVNGNEFAINSNFYTGRKSITFGAITADSDGAVCSNSGVAVEWTNTSGYDINVSAFFLTDVASGSSGKVLWVGTPDAGTSTIVNTEKAIISANDLLLRID